MNATEEAQRYRVGVLGPQGLAMAHSVAITLGPVEERTIPVSVRLPGSRAATLAGQTLPIKFELTQVAGREDAAQVRENTTFHLPH